METNWNTDQSQDFQTVTVQLTNPDDNLTDLINAYAIMGFVAGRTEEELLLSAKHVIENQFFESIMRSGQN